MTKRIILYTLLTLCLTGCNSVNAAYPCIRYRNSAYNYDEYNREMSVLSGYILDQGHSYDIVMTEDGYDMVLHFKKVDNKE